MSDVIPVSYSPYEPYTELYTLPYKAKDLIYGKKPKGGIITERNFC